MTVVVADLMFKNFKSRIKFKTNLSAQHSSLSTNKQTTSQKMQLLLAEQPCRNEIP